MRRSALPWPNGADLCCLLLTYLLFQLGPMATWQRLVRSVVYVLIAIAVIYAFQYAFATLV